MRVASFHAFGPSPEIEATARLLNWKKSHKLQLDSPVVRIFGFNNPDPSPGSPNYGYEFWITVGSDVQPDDETIIKDFSGGLYAVFFCDVSGDPSEIIPASWENLVKWLETSHYHMGNHQWLEEHLALSEADDQRFTLDLYMPITE